MSVESKIMMTEAKPKEKENEDRMDNKFLLDEYLDQSGRIRSMRAKLLKRYKSNK